MITEDRIIELRNPELWLKLGKTTRDGAIKRLQALHVPIRDNSVYWPDVAAAFKEEAEGVPGNYQTTTERAL